MEISDFTLQVSEIALNIDAQGRPITIEEITDTLDRQNHYDKKTYRVVTQRIYNALRTLQIFTWNLWHDYVKTPKYDSDVKLKEYYKNEEDKKTWQDEYFKALYDKRIFSAEQIENSIVESLVFKDFVQELKTKGLILTIAGKGNNEYRVPTLHDFFIYKYQNMMSTHQVFQHQIKDFTKDGLMLPHGVEIARLRDLSQNMIEAFEPKQEDPSK